MKSSETGKSGKKVVIAIAVVVVIALAMFGIYQVFMPKGQAGAKEIHVTVVHADQTSKEFTYQTDEAYLGDVLTAEGLIVGEDGEFGIYIKTVDGETVDESKEQWWCLTKDGESLNTGADQTPIEDGDSFEITLTEGY